MALLWMDGFDHYGAGVNGRLAMLDGVWADIPSTNTTPETVNPRTGAYSCRFNGSSNHTSPGLRRVLGVERSTVGVGGVFYFTALPTANAYGGGNSGSVLYSLRDSANNHLVAISLSTTGQILAHSGMASGTLYGTSAAVITAGAYQHIEARFFVHASTGTIEVRVNGVTVLSLTGLVISSSLVGQVALNPRSGSASLCYLDDIFVWDDQGTENNDFLGDRRVRTQFINGNTASAAWTAVGAATGYECIDEAAPDDETTYIEATGGTTPTSEFEFEDLPAVGAIAAIQTYVRARKTNAGVGNLQTSLVSGASVDAGTDRTITEVYTYYMDVSELDPATGVPWTQSAVNSAKLRIARTA